MLPLIPMAELGRKIVTGLQLKFFILIDFPNILHWKPAKKSQTRCGLGAIFGPNYVQCCEKSKGTGKYH